MLLRWIILFGCLVASPIVAQDSQALWFHPRVRQLPHDHMGPFVHTEDGAILGIDSQNQAILSRDEGATWQATPLFPDIPRDEAPIVLSERALLRTRKGTIILAFMNGREKQWTWKNELFDAPGATLPTYVLRSTDDGRTWNNLRKLHDDWTGANRDMIETSDGRVVFTSMKFLHDPGRHAVLSYSSDDEGVNWRPSNLIDLGGQGHHGGVTEPTLVELADGRVWMLIRTNWGEFWSAYSYDGGQYWRTIQPSGIPSSSAPAIVRRLASGRIVMLWNRPFPEGQESFPLVGGDGLWSEVPVSNHRGELSISFSGDDGRTWSEPIVIARQPNKWLAYPYVFEKAPGLLWITTMQGNVRVEVSEGDFLGT